MGVDCSKGPFHAITLTDQGTEAKRQSTIRSESYQSYVEGLIMILHVRID